MEGLKIDFYKPKSTLLQKYMEGYYFIDDHQHTGTIKYLTFPNNFAILSVNHNSDIILSENRITITPSTENKVVADLVFRYNNPIEVIFEKPIHELTIYFKPLGLNHFVHDLEDVFAKKKNIIDYSPFEDFKQTMVEILTTVDRDRQIELLENYWLSKIKSKDLSLLAEIITDIEHDLKIEDIAIKHRLSRQYINKLLGRNIGKTPSEYRKIHRFRNALIDKSQRKSLSDLSHSNFFFDQSHFIKDFKELTHITPRDFFKNVDTNKENIWLFI